MLARVRELWPEVSVVASHQITREWREYERTSTAVLSAYVQPVAERYLTRLAAGVSRGRASTASSTSCSRTAASTRSRRRRQIPITMVESGPASGFWGAAELGRLIGEPNVLALDIGGTTAKCSLIEGGHVKIITDYWIERSRLSAGYPIMVPVVDLVEIGNGGGSIAWVDDFGKLHVGPAVGGRRSGPGRLRPRRHRGDDDRRQPRARADQPRLLLRRRDRGRHGRGRSARSTAIAERLGVDRAEAARGVVRIANNNMVNALKLISVNRGYDPRDFTLVAFGGGGGMHAVALAAELGIRKVVIPRAADVFSAWGMLMSDLRRDYFLTRLLDRRRRSSAGAARGRLRGARRPPRSSQFAAEGDRRASRSASCATGTCRYAEPGARRRDRAARRPIDAAGRGRSSARFHDAYEREYTYRLDAPVEFVGVPPRRDRGGRQARARARCR